VRRRGVLVSLLWLSVCVCLCWVMAGELYDLWHAHLSPLSTSFQ
jgi:hypothetical protein